MTMVAPAISPLTKPLAWVRPMDWVNDIRFQVATLMAFALTLNREGIRVPAGNELVYLLYFYKAWHPSFLSADWTFKETTAGHAVFNYATGWLTLFMSIEAAAWIGRILSWFGVFAGVLKLGRHFQIPSWSIWVGILLWLAEGQSLVTHDWMIGSFEAKCIAYICLVFAIDAVLNRKFLLAGVLCGLTFSFHSAVGLWAGIALGVAVLAQSPIKQTIRFSLATILFSLPGLITSLPLITGPHPITESEARYWCTVALPDCFDPYSFPRTWLVLMAFFLIFSGCFTWRRRDEFKMRTLFIFEAVIAVFFYLGIVGRAIGWFTFVEMFPMRVYGVFAMLFFFWQMIWLVAATAGSFPSLKKPPILLIFGTLLFLSLPSPMLQIRDMVAIHFARFHQITTGKLSTARSEDADFKAAGSWIQTHTAPTDIVIAPPWRTDGFYYLRRPLVANWHTPRYDAMTQWRERNEILVGDVSRLTAADSVEGNMDEEARSHYDTLPPQIIAKVRNLYGGDWLVTRGKYSYQVAFATDTYSVYRLPAQPNLPK